MTASLHTVLITIAAALCLAGFVYILRFVNEQFQLQHEINLRLPPDEQFEPTFWGVRNARKISTTAA